MRRRGAAGSARISRSRPANNPNVRSGGGSAFCGNDRSSEFAILRKAIAILLIAASPGVSALNLVFNPDFDHDLSGWTVGGGAYRESFFGSPVGGTLRMDGSSNDVVEVATQCVDVHRWPKIDFALRYFVNAQYGSGTHVFSLDIYDAADCAGNKLTPISPISPNEGAAVSISEGIPDSGWLEAGAYDVALPPGSTSALITLGIASGTAANPGGASYMMDHIQVGPLEEIFKDDFEPN